MFKSPIAINESNKGKINFEYNSHLSRSKMGYDYGLIAPNTIKEQRKTKLYTDDGSTEVLFDAVANTIQMRTFIGGDAYIAVLYNEKTINRTTGVTTEHDYYLHRDYLGSILAITNEVGVAQEQRAFDAWGNLAKLVNATGDSVAVTGGLQFFDRGYTSHEHLQEVRLIHMNGRLYDPVLRSFLMPDNFVQQPENTQNYNRYAYCLNNPLKHTDPSGELILIDDAIIIGICIAVASYLVTNYVTDQPISLVGGIQAGIIGGVSAAVTFGIGSACSNIGNFFVRSSVEAVAHGAFQGAMTDASGGKFWSGFAAGALSSIASSAWSGGASAPETHSFGGCSFTEEFVHKGLGEGLGNAGMVAFSTVVGGGAAALTGGNFWVGAATGLVVSVCNHLAHPMDSPDDNGYDERGNKINNKGGDETDYLYRNGKIIGSKNVFSFTDESSEISSDFRAYGVKIHTEGTGSTFIDGMKSTAAFMALEGLGSATSKMILSSTGEFVVRNASWLNKGNWWRLGEGTGKGAGMIRLSFGAHENYINQVPKALQPLNQWIRNNIGSGGHVDFPNWKF